MEPTNTSNFDWILPYDLGVKLFDYLKMCPYVEVHEFCPGLMGMNKLQKGPTPVAENPWKEKVLRLQEDFIAWTGEAYGDRSADDKWIEKCQKFFKETLDKDSEA